MNGLRDLDAHQTGLLLRACMLDGPPAREAWQAYCQLAGSAGWPPSVRPLLPLLHRSLERLGTHDPRILELGATRRVIRYRNLLLLEGAAPAVAGLEEDGIPTLLLKGAALVTAYYDDLGLRPMADVDVLVRSADAGAAFERLATLGWSGEPRPDAWTLAEKHSAPFTREGSPPLDLHWRLLEDAEDAAGEAGLWERARPAGLAGLASRVLDPADQLLHVVAHGMRWSADASLQWVADAWAVMRGGDLAWDRLLAEARRRRLTLAAHDALAGLRDLLDAPIPGDVVEGLRAVRTRRLERWRHRAWLSPPEGRGPLEVFALHHARYRRLVEAGLLRAGLGGLLAAVAREWGLRGPWSVPHHGLVRGARRAAQLAGRGSRRRRSGSPC